MQASGFEQAWHDASNGQLPGGRIAGGWTIEESDDRKQVVVSWEGRGVHIRLCFAIADGNLLTEKFAPGRGPQDGDPAAARIEEVARSLVRRDDFQTARFAQCPRPVNRRAADHPRAH